ncbi:MAG: PAS domain S-box protein [Gammaproteobacteria bacterium]|nr:MAG: PAS domain S-box protein [Gammaproteobacteria bacterium]
MRLQTKVTLIIVIVWGLMVAAIYFGAQRILLNSYLQLENKQVIRKMDQVDKTIERMVDEVETFDTDTAVWDETYNFIVDKNPKSIQDYINANLQITVFSASNVDMMLYFDATGKTVFARAVSADRTMEVPLPSGLYDYLAPNGKLVHQPDLKMKIKGLISIPAGIYLVSSHPILKTDYSGPSRGALIFARYFSPASLSRVEEVTHLHLTLYRLNDIRHQPVLNTIFNQLIDQNKPIAVIGQKKNEILGYLLLKDINDKPIAILQAVIPRTVYEAGTHTIYNFNLLFFGFGILFIIILSYLLRILVINRLEKLSKNIINIESKKKFSLRVNEEGSDELTSVEKETNKTLSIIEEYGRQQKLLLNQVSNELDKANLFSRRLQEAESLLSDIINTMPSILLIINKDFLITHLNSLAEKSIGKSIQEVKGKSIFDFFPYLKNYQNKLNTAVTIDRVIHTTSDTTLYFSVVTYPLHLLGKEQGLAIRIDDISENVKLSENLQKNDRFASIGVLTAGIAHEINNPINFVKSTVTSLKRNIADMTNVMNKYAEIKSSENLLNQLQEIEALKKSLDLDYTIEETHKLLKGMAEGTHRTASIITSLRTFSGASEETMMKFNILEGIDSTLILLKDKCAGKINIIKNYSDIPEIECIPGKLNQVFMNMLSNAIDATPDKGDITIKTEKKGNHVIVSFKDTGTGMSEESKAKIFEPFFTTKDVGKGLGLGLSISFGIISDLKGHIEVKSEVGKGSEFIITLPIHQE